MPAYIIANVEIHDHEHYPAYMRAVPDTIAAYGGRYLARGGKAEKLEGVWDPKRFVILEFESAERARAWWESTEYAGHKALRQRTAHTNMILVEGL